MRKKQYILVIFFLITAFLMGCWDKVEIDDRAYIMVVGIDKIMDEEIVTESLEKPYQDKYSVSFVFPVGGEEFKDSLMVSTGRTIFNIRRSLTTRSGHQIFLGHLQLIILGENLAKDEKMMREVLDAIERSPLITRKVNIAIAKGDARDILEVTPEEERLLGEYMANMFKRQKDTQRAPLIDVGEALIQLHNYGRTTISRVIAGENDVKAAGAAVIRNYKLEGWLDAIDARALAVLRGEIHSIGINADHSGIIVAAEITDGNRKIQLIENDGQLEVLVEITTEGNVVQFYMSPGEDILDVDVLAEISKDISRQLKVELESVISMLQNDIAVDVIGIGEYIQKFRPSIWREISEDWEEMFTEIPIRVKVKTHLRRVGLTR